MVNKYKKQSICLLFFSLNTLLGANAKDNDINNFYGFFYIPLGDMIEEQITKKDIESDAEYFCYIKYNSLLLNMSQFHVFDKKNKVEKSAFDKNNIRLLVKYPNKQKLYLDKNGIGYFEGSKNAFRSLFFFLKKKSPPPKINKLTYLILHDCYTSWKELSERSELNPKNIPINKHIEETNGLEYW